MIEEIERVAYIDSVLSLLHQGDVAIYNGDKQRARESFEATITDCNRMLELLSDGEFGRAWFEEKKRVAEGHLETL